MSALLLINVRILIEPTCLDFESAALLLLNMILKLDVQAPIDCKSEWTTSANKSKVFSAILKYLKLYGTSKRAR